MVLRGDGMVSAQTVWEAALRQAQEPVMVLDGEGRILLCNPAACAALDLAEVDQPQRTMQEVVSHSGLRELLVQTLQDGQPARQEVLLEGGRTFTAQVTPVWAGEGPGPIACCVLIMQDITPLKEMDHLKSDLVSTLAHNLRTPLTNIQGYIGLLTRVGPLNELQQEFVGRVEESVAALNELISDAAEMSSIEAGLDLETVALDLREVIDDAVEEFRPQAQARGQELRWERPAALPLVECSRPHMRQVMDHLLSNAVKYTPVGGRIVVEATAAEQHVVVRVTDTGIGIPLIQQPHIFNRFYRADAASAAGFRGTGLGLAIARSVIEKHNGRVWVESQPDAGSVFSFVLPVAEL